MSIDLIEVFQDFPKHLLAIDVSLLHHLSYLRNYATVLREQENEPLAQRICKILEGYVKLLTSLREDLVKIYNNEFKSLVSEFQEFHSLMKSTKE